MSLRHHRKSLTLKRDGISRAIKAEKKALVVVVVVVDFVINAR